MIEKPFYCTCAVCDSKFCFGPHRYDGRRLSPKTYGDAMVCLSCYQANYDGWGPYAEEKLLVHLARQNLPEPERNQKGWLPRR
jgi:hypothetical protein